MMMVQIFRPCSVLISREGALREGTVLCEEREWREWRAAVSGSGLHLSRKNIESLILCDAAAVQTPTQNTELKNK